ncbi:hypothetical protein H0H92_007762 [Tricholoma furcatifolium]|nr:hypothetical protein H0H92_007762 [Tricholoma furcatifolium]
MFALLTSFAWLALLAHEAHASPVGVTQNLQPRASTAPVSVTLNNVTYVNKGLVAFGLIPANATDSTGDTMGGFGSAIDMKPGTWTQVSDGTYTGTLVVTPDRGYNVDGTVDYQARQHEIAFVLSPYYNSTVLTFAQAQQTLSLTYLNTTLRFERNYTKTSGLDPSAVRSAMSGFPTVYNADPAMPIASTSEPHLTLDVEGLVANYDGSFWISDEYGPYIYKYTGDGQLIQTIQPPQAIIPLDKNGDYYFTSEDDPKTGRAANQGFEGLTLDRVNQVLYAMLQSATMQDGGDSNSNERYTRLVAYDVSDETVTPPLVGEWVVPLPLYNNQGNDDVEACSEIHFVSPGIFLALSRDAKGNGGSSSSSNYKQADLFSISGATDIHGTEYDEAANAVAPKGKLVSGVTPATYVSFVNYLESNGLARFGLHNGSPTNDALIDGKWESLTLVPIGDSEYPDDYFLFTAADNDFLTTDGVSLGQPYNADSDVPNQFMVFRVTLPGASSYQQTFV